MRHIKAHFDYISRDGKVAIEDENGDIYLGRESLKELRDAWAKGGIGIPLEGEGRKEAFNVVLSMPPGTDREGVKAAVRGFASEQFRNHQYAFAAHEDEDHPHVHLTIKAMDRHGIRLNPRKGDLRFWREQFARKLREQGIEANATPRRARGVVQKAEKQALRHMENEFKEGKRQVPPRSFQAQRQDAELEADIGTKHLNPLHDRISSVRKQTLKAYGEIARTLAAGDDEDKRLALEIVRFVQTMPATITKHEELVQRLREKKNMHAEPEKTGIPGHDRTKPGVDYSR
ncbi:MAG TPA: relaxase/mobilization nuclease domain-containing protein [Oligoflexus sp.]|uniref:relaxase/mobilization nuclease domain-containing protein n=1 Tax=Oligoflexus sp. TaxID=1971216 RepID=UPI002D7FFF16|nr:relaxase/mobilization nuclease domain-containing protein [Oligoflexus sp.]HET9239193.1 relaxase/mobilization nuclease domain-containing protein [Oligoflexus sp.]